MSLPDLAAMVLAGCHHHGSSSSRSIGGLGGGGGGNGPTAATLPLALAFPDAAVANATAKFLPSAAEAAAVTAVMVSEEAARKACEKLLLDLTLALPGEVMEALGGWLQRHQMPEGTFTK